MPYNNYPIEECADAIHDILEQNPDAKVFQKWTCEGCGRRVTGCEVNKLARIGHCDDCGHNTDIDAHGCNYMVVQAAQTPEQMDAIMRVFAGGKKR